MGSGGAGDFDQFKNTPEMNKLLKDPSGVNRRIFIGGIVPQDGQIDKFRSELERTFRKYGLIEGKMSISSIRTNPWISPLCFNVEMNFGLCTGTYCMKNAQKLANLILGKRGT
jgi:hypothetical protein